MIIVDGQVHIWKADTPERPWPLQHNKADRETPLSAEGLLEEMAMAGVDRALLLSPSWEGERNDYTLEAARRYPDRFAVIGRLDVSAPDAREQLSTWRLTPRMLTARLTFRNRQISTNHWLWEVAEHANVPLMVAVYGDYATQLENLRRVSETYPELRLAICHMGIQKGRKDNDAFVDLDKLLSLAKRPNIAVTLTCVPYYSMEPYPHPRLHPYLRRIYDAFGPARMFWGSDLSRLNGTYRQAVSMFTQELPWLNAEDKTWVMGRGICEWIGWETSSAWT